MPAHIDSTCPACNAVLIVDVTQRPQGIEYPAGYSVGLSKPPPLGTCVLSEDPHEEGEHAEAYGDEPGECAPCTKLEPGTDSDASHSLGSVTSGVAPNSAQQGAAPAQVGALRAAEAKAQGQAFAACLAASTALVVPLPVVLDFLRDLAAKESVSGWLAAADALEAEQRPFYAHWLRALAPPSAPPVQQIEDRMILLKALVDGCAQRTGPDELIVYTGEGSPPPRFMFKRDAEGSIVLTASIVAALIKATEATHG